MRASLHTPVQSTQVSSSVLRCDGLLLCTRTPATTPQLQPGQQMDHCPGAWYVRCSAVLTHDLTHTCPGCSALLLLRSVLTLDWNSRGQAHLYPGRVTHVSVRRCNQAPSHIDRHRSHHLPDTPTVRGITISAGSCEHKQRLCWPLLHKFEVIPAAPEPRPPGAMTASATPVIQASKKQSSITGSHPPSRPRKPSQQ